MHDREPLLPSSFVGGAREAGFDVERLPSPADALARFFSLVDVRPCGTEHVSLDQAAGRVLANDAVARDDIPAHDRATMDGFAMASSDGAAPRRIAGDVAMGRAAPHPVAPGEALRVPTGGALPDGADTVVPIEDCALGPDGIVVPHRAPPAGDCIARRASDIARGTLVLASGRRLGGPELGVLATLGIAEVPVYRRPRVAILSTGDELIDPGEPLGPGRVRDSNRYALAASLRALGAEPVHCARVPDRPDALEAALRAALAECDAVFSSGGSSVGERDFVPAVVASLGAPGPIVHGLRVRPGKPTLLAAVGATPIVGLPGNPTSSLMILEAVARPIVRALTGEAGSCDAPLRARAAQTFSGRPGWVWFVPVALERRGTELLAVPLTMRSSQTSLLARAAGFVTVDGASPGFSEGEEVLVTQFASGGAPIGI